MKLRKKFDESVLATRKLKFSAPSFRLVRAMVLNMVNDAKGSGWNATHGMVFNAIHIEKPHSCNHMNASEPQNLALAAA